MTAVIVAGCALLLAIVASLAIHYRNEALGLPEWDDSDGWHDRTAALTRAVRREGL